MTNSMSDRSVPSREDLGNFRRGRARALQAIYAWDLRPNEDLSQVAVRVWDDLAVSAEERKFASHLMRKVISDLDTLDAQLGELTTNWRLERLGVIERSVLRLGAAELAQRETPPKVAIQEAVRLAERFGSARSARFVNGILDAFARQIGTI
jgi:transcription antitermination protein NusB